MFFEQWNTQFDIEKLRSQLSQITNQWKPVLQSAAFGGWSVLSSNGSYTDGWHRGFVGLDQKMSLEDFRNQTQKNNGLHSDQYCHPTEICNGYLKEIIDYIGSKNLRPSRARIIRLEPHSACAWHRDAPDGIYSVRLHVPIVTNPNAFFETENAQVHFPADGNSYFISVDRMHRVVNHGEEPRFHLVMNVTDWDGVSRLFRKTPGMTIS